MLIPGVSCCGLRGIGMGAHLVGGEVVPRTQIDKALNRAERNERRRQISAHALPPIAAAARTMARRVAA